MHSQLACAVEREGASKSYQGLEDGAEHCTEVISHAHTSEVVHEHRTSLADAQDQDGLAALDQLDGVQAVL